MYMLSFSQSAGVFRFIPQVTDLVNERICSFQQWHSVMSQATTDCDEYSEKLHELIKSSFNTILLASQYIIKQYNMLQSQLMKSSIYMYLYNYVH